MRRTIIDWLTSAVSTVAGIVICVFPGVVYKVINLGGSQVFVTLGVVGVLLTILMLCSGWNLVIAITIGPKIDHPRIVYGAAYAATAFLMVVTHAQPTEPTFLGTLVSSFIYFGFFGVGLGNLIAFIAPSSRRTLSAA